MTADVWIPRLLPGTPDPVWPDDGAFRAGVYDGMDEAAYHADPVPGGSLSASGAKKLLPPSCPARYQYDRLYGEPPRKTFEHGTAAHSLVLGTGPKLVIVDAPDWRTKAAQEARDQARFDGHVPLLPADALQVQEMAAAIRRHPLADTLLDPERGDAEQSLFWRDDETGIWRRARLDYLPRPRRRRRLVIPDYKTCERAGRESVRKAVANYGYHIQAAQYTDGVRALGLDEDPAFVFIFQEKTPPYLVNVVQLDDDAMAAGRERMRLACEMFRDCTGSGIWPGYSDDTRDPDVISLPPWAARPVEDLYA
jgi:PDDEXK-like domain of unknown function (DUF3799)